MLRGRIAGWHLDVACCFACQWYPEWLLWEMTSATSVWYLCCPGCWSTYMQSATYMALVHKTNCWIFFSFSAGLLTPAGGEQGCWGKKNSAQIFEQHSSRFGRVGGRGTTGMMQWKCNHRRHALPETVSSKYVFQASTPKATSVCCGQSPFGVL